MTAGLFGGVVGTTAGLQLPRVSLEIAFSNGPLDATPVWTPIDSDLLAFTTLMGRQHQLDRVNPTTLKATIDNRQGNYSPWDTSSPFYNLLSAIDSSFTGPSAGTWTAGAGTATAVSTAGLFGTSSLQLTASGTKETVTSGKYAAAVGNQYSAGAYLLASSTGTAFQVGLAFFNSGGTQIGSTTFGSTITTNSSTWTQGTVTATAPSGTVTMAVVVSSTATTSNTNFVDCVMLCLNPSVGTVVSPPIGWTLGQTLPLVPGKPVRMIATWASVSYPIFYGFADAWTPVPTDALNQTATLDAADVLELLNLKLLQNNTLYPNEVLGTTPLAYWRFGETGGFNAVDSSGNSRTATYNGAPDFSVSGSQLYDPNTAVTLTSGVGGSFVVAPAMPGQGGAGGFSFGIWFKTTDGNQQILTWAANAGSFPTAVWAGVDGNGHLALFDGVAQIPPWTVLSAPVEKIIGTIPVNDGLWHRLVVTMSAPGVNSTWTLYQDGISLGTWAGEYWSETDVQNLYIGGLFNLVNAGTPAQGTFDGTVDEAQVWAGVLTPTQVATDYTVGSYFQNVEFTGQRIAKTLIVAGFGSFPQNLATGSVLCAPETSSLTQTLTGDYCLEANDTENGLFYQDPSGVIQFKDRHYPQINSTTTTSQATLGDNPSAAFHYDVTGLTIPQDRLDLWPDVQTQRNNGTIQQVTTAASGASFGFATLQRTGLLMNADPDALYLAQWLAYLYANPLVRVSSVLLSSLSAQGANLPIMLGLLLWESITMQRQGAGESQLSQMNVIEGTAHNVDFSQGTWKTTWQLSPFEVSAAANLALILDSATNGILGTNVVGG